MHSPPGRLCRKQIAAHFGVERTTVWRWERRHGLRLHDGCCASVAEIEWFLLQRDQARRMKIPTRTFLRLPREMQIDLIFHGLPSTAALQHLATLPHETIGQAPR